MAMAESIPVTVTGVELYVALLPLPSCPPKLAPQQRTDPPTRRAQPWAPPALMAMAESIETTGLGMIVLSVLPVPRRPKTFPPQQRAEPSATRAHV